MRHSLKKDLFKEKTALITGASSGIGRELAFLFAAAGARLIITGRSLQRLSQVKNIIDTKWGIPCKIIPASFSSIENIRNFMQTLALDKAQVDILINNAGFATYGYFHKLDINREIEELNVNIIAPLCLTHFFLKSMLERNQGWILNMASTAALLPGCPFEAVYGGSKSFLASFSLALAQEYKNTNISISCVLPGNTDTEFWSTSDNLKRKFAGKRKGMASPQEVARFAFNALIAKKSFAVFALKTRIKSLLLPLMPRAFLNKITRDSHYESFLEGKY